MAAALTICGTDYFAAFSKEGCDGPCLTLTAGEGVSGGTTYTGVRESAGCNYAVFAFGHPDLCPGDEAAGGPCNNLLRIRVEWVEQCPVLPGWYCARDEGSSDPYQAVELPTGDPTGLDISSGPYSTHAAALAACPPEPGVLCTEAGGAMPLDYLVITAVQPDGGIESYHIDIDTAVDGTEFAVFMNQQTTASIENWLRIKASTGDCSTGTTEFIYGPFAGNWAGGSGGYICQAFTVPEGTTKICVCLENNGPLGDDALQVGLGIGANPGGGAAHCCWVVGCGEDPACC